MTEPTKADGTDAPAAGSAADNSAEREEFYVGYRPTPPGYVRFVWFAGPAVVFLMVGVGLYLAARHGSAGRGQWDADTVVEFEGVAYAEPYAMIRVWGESRGSGPRTMLLVSEGKHGAVDRMRPFDGRNVRVRGTLLSRDGQRLMELSSDDGAIVETDNVPPLMAAQLRRSNPRPLGPVTLRGEIIDPKCYFGAMKPGEGKTHKECATLCISGGIPPMFKTQDARGMTTYYLLTDSQGAAVNQGVLPFVADPVEVRGELEQWGDQLVLKISPSSIRRL